MSPPPRRNQPRLRSLLKWLARQRLRMRLPTQRQPAAKERQMLKITLKRSLIGYEKSQRLTANALGLGKVGSVATQPDNQAIRGMIFKIKHVLEVAEVPEAAQSAPAKKGK